MKENELMDQLASLQIMYVDKCRIVDALQAENEKLIEAVKKCNEDHWFMINLIERYSSDKEQALKDCLERMKFRKPMYEKALADYKKEG